MAKAYLIDVEAQPNPKTKKKTYWFGWEPEQMHWSTKESADHQCNVYNSLGGVSIEIPNSGGNKQQFTFDVEKIESGEFVLFCEVPFGPKLKGESASPEP